MNLPIIIDFAPIKNLKEYKRLIYNVKDHVNQVILKDYYYPNDYLYEIIAYTKQHGIDINYTTSGEAFTPEKVEILKMCRRVNVVMNYSALKMLIDAGVTTNIVLTDPMKFTMNFNGVNAVVFTGFEVTKEFLDIVNKGPYKIGIDPCMIIRNSNNEQKLICEYARIRAHVTSEMKLQPCAFSKEDGVDITSIKEAWYSDLFQKFRSKLEEKPFECPWKSW